ncbi:MAG TPA: TMEM14 family protein [Nitrosopumilaceae archaeon]|nr:TMEM14 family protein [Nitrosopumilaceae archaeon]
MEEIEIPKELGPFILDKAEETSLGQKNGAKKQYRYGNLHIREYDDKFLVHTDKIDPRKSPLAHLVFDAPEILIGLASAVIGGGKVTSYMKKNNKNSIIPGVFASLVFGYLGFSLTKKIKNLQ